MLLFKHKTAAAPTSHGTLTLSFEQRSKSRLRAQLDNGEDVGIQLARGEQLFAGDRLQAESGEVVEVRAALETVSEITSDDPYQLARACYHLGNRHIALQINPGRLRYLHDHVLDDMVELLGLSVRVKQASFEPESGAYGAHAHIHDHAH